MKVNHDLVWSEQHADKTITIGFTKKAIDEVLPECFHVMQADSTNVREKGPMLVLETNDGLESIKAPFAGRVSYFNSKARNYPDKLTEEDTILTLAPVGSKPSAPVKSVDLFAQPVITMPPAPDWATLAGNGQALRALEQRNAQMFRDMENRVAQEREAARNMERVRLEERLIAERAALLDAQTRQAVTLEQRRRNRLGQR